MIHSYWQSLRRRSPISRLAAIAKRLALLAFVFGCLATRGAVWAETPPDGAPPNNAPATAAQCNPAQASANTPDDVDRLAATIDYRISERWSAEHVVAAPPADDAEFLRRVHLDLAGKIPSVADVRAFLEDTSPNKRRAAVDHLLESSGYVVHFTNQWRSMLMPEAATEFETRFMVPSFEAWLRQELTANTSYDELVRKLLTAPLGPNAQANLYNTAGQATPLAYFQAKQLKPENLAASTARMFLGMRIECAQCHDHPFDSWKREDFWSYAAFFVGLERQGGGGILATIRELLNVREVTIPDDGRVVQAAFLDGKAPTWKSGATSRDTLAEWITARDNPFFARAMANRVWAMLFGTGLVTPLDDFSANNPPSHPELLDELGRALVEHNYDLKFLLRSIVASRTYQLSSMRTDPSQDDPRKFARAALRGLTPEQLFASLDQATGGFEPYATQNPFAFGAGTPRAEVLETFANDSDIPTERQTSILQSLLLMNGQYVADGTSIDRGGLLSAVADFPMFTTADKVETLFLASVNRKPRADELERLVKFVDTGGPAKDSRRALGDVLWALVNSSEFLFNH